MKTPQQIVCFVISLLLLLSVPHSAWADIQDPFDPFAWPLPSIDDETDDSEKTAEELVGEAEILFLDERLLDGRTKLLKALRKNPKYYEAHLMLSSYYLIHVGHFRLALRYVRQAQELFQEEHGPPPYSSLSLKSQHAHLLHLLSQARLNLDNYSGALRALDDYESHGYFQEWYPGSRAWVLMKLGKLDEAIRTAQVGYLAGGELGRTLNILGILFSMSGERKSSLRVFREAIAYEFSLGNLGQPATPLNNSGEVYREIFREDMAEKSWLKATSLPDGCEHVLPSLNLAILYIEQTKYAEARRAIDNFESCVAQFPLRNGEEHRALVHLARGRIAMHTGLPDIAISHLERTLERRQWFGKIGTSEEDLQAAATISMVQALNRSNNLERFRSKESFLDRLSSWGSRVQNRLRAWWIGRRAKQVLTEELSGIEDIYVRNTDSMIEYPTFGEILAHFPYRALEERIQQELKRDGRLGARPYYQAYLAENALRSGRVEEGLKLLQMVLRDVRPVADDALKLHVLLLRMRYVALDSGEYASNAYIAYSLAPASVRSYGELLPVNFSSLPPQIADELSEGPFLLQNKTEVDGIVTHGTIEGRHSLRFTSRSGLIPSMVVEAEDIGELVNKFSNRLFSEPASPQKKF